LLPTVKKKLQRVFERGLTGEFAVASFPWKKQKLRIGKVSEVWHPPTAPVNPEKMEKMR
jgi:hypothetical protein